MDFFTLCAVATPVLLNSHDPAICIGVDMMMAIILPAAMA